MNRLDRLAARWADYQQRRAARARYGDCPDCGHDWREHDRDRGCGECAYEIEHEEPNAPLTVCTTRAPGYTYEQGR